MKESRDFAAWFNNEFVKWQSGFRERQTILSFSKWLDIHPVTVNNWLQGSRTPSKENVNKIAKKLGHEIYEILDVKSPDPQLRQITSNWYKLPMNRKEEVLEYFNNQLRGLEQNHG